MKRKPCTPSPRTLALQKKIDEALEKVNTGKQLQGSTGEEKQQKEQATETKRFIETSGNKKTLGVKRNITSRRNVTDKKKVTESGSGSSSDDSQAIIHIPPGGKKRKVTQSEALSILLEQIGTPVVTAQKESKKSEEYCFDPKLDESYRGDEIPVQDTDRTPVVIDLLSSDENLNSPQPVSLSKEEFVTLSPNKKMDILFESIIDIKSQMVQKKQTKDLVKIEQRDSEHESAKLDHSYAESELTGDSLLDEEIISSDDNNSAVRPFKCEVCIKTFKTNNDLKKHMVFHGEKKFKCDKCTKSFYQKYTLKYHLMTHDKKFIECKECGKRCKKPADLTIHMRSHTGNYPYKCSMCGKGYSNKTQYEAHVYGHEDVYPYKCGNCDVKKYKHPAHLKRHLAKCRQEKSSVCDKCGEKFSNNKSLENHLKSNHQSKFPLNCTLCGAELYNEASVIAHNRLHHGSMG